VTRVTEDGLGELLSIFPLTVAVQRIALEAAETLGVNPIAHGPAHPRCGLHGHGEMMSILYPRLLVGGSEPNIVWRQEG
jgi:hypothetical protein